ncbi:MAG TPA: LruC domain-containing protein [Candidatus Cloacimonadota bacterium]|nr:LruC domain-containing protein [Candidatus Cloacimonadota bacterium]
MKRMQIGVILVLLLVAIFACDNNKTKITSMKDLKVNEMFTFQTVKPVKLILNSVTEQGDPLPGADFTIMRSDSKKVLKARTNSSGSFEFTITVPSYERKITLVSGEDSVELNLPSDGELIHTFTGTTTKAKATYSYFTPAEGIFGSLCFEDFWPSNGDYDLNDLVLDFNVEEVYDEDTWELTNLIFKYKVRAIGARKTIGFGITLPDYIYASDDPISTNNMASWDAAHNTLVFFNNARDAVSDDPANFFNTDYALPHNSDSEIVHEINLPAAEDWGKSSRMVWIPWYSAPFNPFIYIDNDISHQIHLKHYPIIPGYMNMALFNQVDDNSDVTYPDYPQSFQNLNFQPWAFYIAESIQYPREQTSILRVFPDFADWALSDGWDYQDWYQNPNLNYIYDPNH